MKKSDVENLIKDLYNEIRDINIEPKSEDLVSLADARGRGRMKIEVLKIFNRRFCSPNTRKTHEASK